MIRTIKKIIIEYKLEILTTAMVFILVMFCAAVICINFVYGF